MREGNFKINSEKIITFQERILPEPAVLAGYAALIKAYEIKVPLPLNLCATSDHHKVYEKNNWRIFTARHKPRDFLEGHLTFALKYEGLDLLVLKRLFEILDKRLLTTLVKSKATSSYMRRLWFLYEWLFEEELNIENVAEGNYVDALDTKLQFGINGEHSPRHRVRNNLPGTKYFCPLVFRSKTLDHYTKLDLSNSVQKVIGKTSADILARTASFLLLKDSKSSYAIEGETKPYTRIQRWGRAIGEAGKQPLDMHELLRLQKIVIGDNRFVQLGLRKEGGFVGEHERNTRLPLPEHISAREEDLESLMQGIFDFNTRTYKDLDAVIVATCIAFGFVFIHPFVDGNGRLHRYLIHHVLMEKGFAPRGIVFPISSAILERIDDYRKVLESYSKRTLPFIDWEPTHDMNVNVLNETIDFYRYFDATPQAEFLYSCVEKTIIVDLPNEIHFLEQYDIFKNRIENLIEMPTSKINLLFNFLKQNDGVLSKRALEKEFKALGQAEVKGIEDIYAGTFLHSKD